MQFIKREDDFSPTFSVWSIERITINLLSNRIKSGHYTEPFFIRSRFQHLLPDFLSGSNFFEFKFYR